MNIPVTNIYYISKKTIKYKEFQPKISQFSENTFHACDDVVHESSGDSLVHGRVLLRAGLHVQELDQRLDGDALNEHRPVDHGDRRSHEHGAVRNFLEIKKKKN